MEGQRPAEDARYGSGLWPSWLNIAQTWGYAPGWYGAAPLALLMAAAGAEDYFFSAFSSDRAKVNSV